MTLDKFVNEYNNAPLELTDFAECALNVNDKDLKHAAQDYLDAREDFISALNAIGVEQG